MNNENKKPPTRKRVYKRITPRTVAIHQAQALITGNNASAVRELEPEYIDEYSRASRIARKSNEQSINEYIEQGLQQIGEQAVIRLGELVNSSDEQVAARATMYAIDHLRGKAVTKSISVTAQGNIQDVL